MTPLPESEPNYWVDESITSGWVVGGSREGVVVARADTLEEAERICRELNGEADEKVAHVIWDARRHGLDVESADELAVHPRVGCPTEADLDKAEKVAKENGWI